MSTTAILELEHAGASIALRLEPDPDGARPALARGAGFALSHVGPLEGALRPILLAAARAFAGGDAGTIGDAVARLRAAVAGAEPTARLSIAVTVSGARGLTRWPSSLRSGAPVLARGGIWPFDAELAGLRLGTRRVIKRECFSDPAAAADRAWLESNGVRVRATDGVDADGRRILFGALDAAALDEALDRDEAALRARGDEAAIRRLGAALGYPTCCIDAFVAAGADDDLSLVAALLPPLGHAPAPPHTQWLNQPLAIASHVPCGLECAATIDLVTALVDALDADHPGFATAWRHLAARVHAIAGDGRAYALAGSGALTTGFAVEDAVELCMPPRADPNTLMTPAPELIGRTLSIVDGALSGGADLSCVAAADHTRL